MGISLAVFFILFLALVVVFVWFDNGEGVGYSMLGVAFLGLLMSIAKIVTWFMVHINVSFDFWIR